MSNYNFGNLHIHNSNSRCAYYRYPLRLLVETAKDAKLNYVGSTNHVFPSDQIELDVHPEERTLELGQMHLKWTKAELDALPHDVQDGITVFFGAECNIYDASGETFLLPKYRELLDYWIAGMHTFWNEEMVASFFSEDFNADYREEALEDYFDEALEWVLPYLEKSKPNILVHPFWQEFTAGLIREDLMYNYIAEVCDVAKKSGTAIELNTLLLRTQRPRPPFWNAREEKREYYPYMKEVFTNLFKIVLEKGCLISLGSDAHTWHRIDDVWRAKDILENIGATNDDIYVPVKKSS